MTIANRPTNQPTDLWWAARQKTLALQQAEQKKLGVKVFKNITQSLPGQPTRTSFATLNLGRANACLSIDLNKYRSGKDLKAYWDAGVDLFILRIGGPTRWYDGNWGYQIDATYQPYLEQLDKLGLLHRSIGYIVHNPFEQYSVNGATGETMHTELIDDWTSGGYMPGAFVYDHEVGTMWRGGTEIKISNYNVVKSLEVNTDNTYKKFKRMVGIYTARWFTNLYGPVEHTVYFDNVNKAVEAGGPGMQRPMWWAWYAQDMSKQYTNLQDALSDLLVPTPQQEAKLLNMGSYSKGPLWQFTDRLKLTGDTTGVDASVSLGSLEECLAAFGLKVDAPKPDPEVPPTTPPTDTAAADAKQIMTLIAQWQKKYGG